MAIQPEEEIKKDGLGPIIIGGGADKGNAAASADDVEVGGDITATELGVEREDRIPEIPLSPEAQQAPGFIDSVVEGFGFSDDSPSWWEQYKDGSVTHGAGGLTMESLMQTGFKGVPPNRELLDTNQASEIYRKWQPQIWNAEDQLMKAGDKTSPQYQAAYSNLQELRKNMRDNLEGTYKPDPTEPISIGKIIDAAADNPGLMMGALAKGIAQDPGLMATPTGWVKAGDAAVKLSKLVGAGKKTQAAAKVAGQVLGGGSITGGFGATENVLDQLKRNPNAPINMENVMKAGAAMSIMGAAPPPLIAAAKGATTAVSNAVSNFYSKAKLEQIQKEAINIYNEAEGGISKQDAVDLAVARNHPYDSEILTTLDPEKVVDDTAARIAYAERVTPETFTEKVKRVTVQNTTDVMAGWNNLVQPVLTGVRRLGFMGVASDLMRHDMREMKKLSDRLLIKDAYSKARKGLSDTDKDLLKFHALNGTLKDVAGDFPDEVIQAYTDVRKMLDDMRAEMIENGMLRKKPELDEDGLPIDEDKLPGIEDFWPRDIDFKSYAKARGIDVKESFDLYAKYINKKYNLNGVDAFEGKDLTADLINEYLSPEEIAFAIADEVSGKIVPSTTLTTNPLKKRTVELIEPEDLQFYADDVQSLTTYILKMTPKIEARNFFGGKLLKSSPQARERFLSSEDVPSNNPLKNSMISGFVNDYTKALGKQNAILSEKVPELAGLLESRFAGGFKRPNQFIAGAKNIMYGMLLGNAWSAAVQLGDLGSSAYINGTQRTLNAVTKKALKKAGVDVGDLLDMDDFGLSAMAHELEHLGPTAAFNDMALKVGMFKMADRMGKEAIMNASVAKNMKATKELRDLLELDRSESIFEPNYDAKVKAAREKAKKHFRKQYGDKVDEPTLNSMVDAFARGEIRSPDAMLATFADITKVQPVSMSEMPKLYLNHPNGRIVYMLKTFTLKQVDLLRTSIIQRTVKEVKEAKSKKGKIAAIARGNGRMLHLLGTVGLANAGVDATRQFLLGDPDFELSEIMFSAAFFRTWGYHPYLADLVAQGRIGEASGALFFPPVGVVTEPIGELAEGDVGGFLLTLPVLRAAKQFADQEDDTVVDTFGGLGLDSGFDTSFDTAF